MDRRSSKQHFGHQNIQKPILVYITHWIEKNLERVVERIMKVFTLEGKLVINGSYLCKFKEGQSPLGVP